MTAVQNAHGVTSLDWSEFIAVCYFGSNDKGDWLDRCVRRGYLDMSRTLYGMTRFSKAHGEWRPRMTSLLRQQLDILPATREWTADAFDEWHWSSVTALQALSESLGYGAEGTVQALPRARFTVGQAQKWINMSIKYTIALGESRIPGFSGVHPVAHAALDGIVISALVRDGMDSLNSPWSKLNDYGRYMDCQVWIRGRYPGETSLQVENRLWLRAQSREGFR